MKGTRPLDNNEIRLVSACFDGTFAARNRGLFMLGVSTGGRISELLSLTIGNVYQNGKPVTDLLFDKSIVKGGEVSRAVPVNTDGRRSIENLIAWHRQQYNTTHKRSSLRNINIPGVTALNTLSTGGVSLCFHNNVGFETPFAGAVGYYRQPATCTYTGQPQTVNLGLLCTVEYMDSVWTKDVFGVKPKIDAKILLLSGMIGMDIQTPSRTLVAAGGLAFTQQHVVLVLNSLETAQVVLNTKD